MAKKTKYCLNYVKGRHLNDGKSPSHMHCSECYPEVKERYDSIERHGGALVGLRAARTLSGGSFGYETTQGEKERNLNAFFHYVMPHIPGDVARKLSKDISQQNSLELQKQDGSYIKVIPYSNR